MTTDDQFGATCLECGILRLHIVNLERDLAAARAEAAGLREMRCDGCRYYDDMERAAFTLPFCRKWSSDGPQPNTVFCMDIKGCLAWEKRDA